MITNATKSPIKTPPLRQPGQYLREKKDDILNDQVWPFLMAVIMIWLWAMLDWCGTWFHLPRQPWIYTLIAVIYTGYAYL